MTKNSMKERPLSPHLQVYKPQLSSVTSILHRMTGVALSVGFGFVIWGLVALADGRESYESFVAFLSSVAGQIVLAGLSVAFTLPVPLPVPRCALTAPFHLFPLDG